MTTFTLDEVRRIVGTPECTGSTPKMLRMERQTLHGRTVAFYPVGPEVVAVMVYSPNGVRTILATAQVAADIAAQALRDAGYILAEDISL